MRLYFLSAVLVILLLLCVFVLPKFKLISGFAAKNMASNYFLAHRNKDIIQNIDNGTALVRLAKTKINTSEKTVTATVFGIYKSKAIYKDGLGAILLNGKKNIEIPKPNRNFTKINLPYPHGHLPPEKFLDKQIDQKKIEITIKNVFKNNHPHEIKNTRAVVVLYKGKLLAEHYSPGFDKYSLHQSWSITKSLFTTSFGVLQKQGLKIDKPITDFKHWKNTDKQDITIRDLLQMQSGINWEEDYSKISDVTKMLFKDMDCTKRSVYNNCVAKPGTIFNYGGGDTNVLSAVLRKQFDTLQEYLDFPYLSFIDKIGMHSMLMETDVLGNYVASTYSWATARDWAKFGQFMLQNGMWNGEQILSDNWVNFVKTPAKSAHLEYGGQWWLNKGKFMPNVPEDCFYADGFQGQRIFVIPSKDLVVVRFGVTNLDRELFYPLFNTLLNGICTSII